MHLGAVIVIEPKRLVRPMLVLVFRQSRINRFDDCFESERMRAVRATLELILLDTQRLSDLKDASPVGSTDNSGIVVRVVWPFS